MLKSQVEQLENRLENTIAFIKMQKQAAHETLYTLTKEQKLHPGKID